MPYNSRSRSLKLSTTPRIETIDLEGKLSKPYKDVLQDWEHSYQDKANQRWRQNHNKFVTDLFSEQEAYESSRSARRERQRLRSLERGGQEVEVVRLGNIGTGTGTIATTAGDIFSTQVIRPVQYILDGTQFVGNTQQVLVPVNKMALNFNQNMLQPANFLANLQPGVYEIDTGPQSVIGSDCYEIVEETVSGDTTPFGVTQKRRLLRDGSKTKRQEMLDLTVKQGGSVGRKLPALDLAEANGLSRSAVRNRIDKKTGQQHIQYVYEGFGNDGLVVPTGGSFGTTSAFLSQPTYYTAVPAISEGARATSKYLNGPTETKIIPTSPSSYSYLEGTSLDPYRVTRPRKSNRFSFTKNYESKSDDKPNYSYLDYLYFPSEGISDVKASSSSTALARVNKGMGGKGAGDMPFGLNYDDLALLDEDVFQTVQVDLAKRRMREEGGWKPSGIDYVQRFRRRRASTDGLLGSLGSPTGGGYVASTVPGMAGHMAGVVVNGALDRLFGHGHQRAVYNTGNRDLGFLSEYAKGYSAENKRRQQKWMEEYEREARDRERRRKERELERKAEMRRIDSDWEREKRERDRRDADRKGERDAERRRREKEWELQQEEWERQKERRERERELLRKERERIEQEAKNKQKFDPRVHTVDLPDSQAEGEVAKATPSEVADTVATVRSPQPQTRPKKKMLNEVSEHDPGEVNNDRDPGVWEGHGHFKDERVIFNSDKGYISWTKPKGSLEVIYKNPDGLLQFGCKVEPRHPGMKVYEVREDAEVLISTGKGEGAQGALEFTAIDGVVIIVIETYEDEADLPERFRLDWALHV